MDEHELPREPHQHRERPRYEERRRDEDQDDERADRLGSELAHPAPRADPWWKGLPAAIITAVTGITLTGALAYVQFTSGEHGRRDDARFQALEAATQHLLERVQHGDEDRAVMKARQERVLEDLRKLDREITDLDRVLFSWRARKPIPP